MGIFGLIKNLAHLAVMFGEWLKRTMYRREGREEQIAIEKAELDRQEQVTDEEDAKAAADSDAVINDELKRPL